MSTNDPEPASFPDDEQNPYAPPRSDLYAELVPSDLTPMPFTLGDVLSRSWEIYRDRMGFCIGLVVVWYLVTMGANGVLQFLLAVAPQARNPLLITGLGFVAYMVFATWTGIGLNLVLLEVARGRDASIGGVFGGGRMLLKVFVALLLYFLLMGGAIALGAAPGGIVWAATGNDSLIGPIAFGLGCFAGFVAAVLVALRISQFYYLIIDRDAGIAESFRLSMQITRGRMGMIFLLYLITFAVNMAGVMACLVGVIFTMPFCYLLIVVTYLAMTGQPTADPTLKGEPYVDLEPL